MKKKAWNFFQASAYAIMEKELAAFVSKLSPQFEFTPLERESRRLLSVVNIMHLQVVV